MSRHTTSFEWTIGTGDDERDVTLDVSFDFVRGCPETPPAYWHGGLPAEPDEADVISVTVTEPDGTRRAASNAEIAQWFDSSRGGQMAYEKLIEAAHDRHS